MKFYIADPHFNHSNIIHYDERPWETVDEMNEGMIEKWNAKVSNDDEVYILGDLCFGSAKSWRKLLPRLNGKKYLILGNHDLANIPRDVEAMFEEPPVHYKEIKDNGYEVLMSHYPMVCFKHDYSDKTIMLYGHVHNTYEAKATLEAYDAFRRKCDEEKKPYYKYAFNVWCGFYDWTPATLNEILLKNRSK